MAITQQDILNQVNTVNNSNTTLDENHADYQASTGIGLQANIHYKSMDGVLRTRDFLIRSIIYKDNCYYINAIAQDINMPRLIPASHIIYITDIASNMIYKNPYQFMQNKLGIEVDNALLNEDLSDFAKAIKELGPELTVLMYLVAIDGVRTADERDCVLAYATARVPHLVYDNQEMVDYLVALIPDDDTFAKAFHQVLVKGKIVVEPLLETVLKIIIINGEIHTKEKALLARLIDLMKHHGYDINLTM